MFVCLIDIVKEFFFVFVNDEEYIMQTYNLNRTNEPRNFCNY